MCFSGFFCCSVTVTMISLINSLLVGEQASSILFYCMCVSCRSSRLSWTRRRVCRRSWGRSRCCWSAAALCWSLRARRAVPRWRRQRECARAWRRSCTRPQRNTTPSTARCCSHHATAHQTHHDLQYIQSFSGHEFMLCVRFHITGSLFLLHGSLTVHLQTLRNEQGQR